MDIFKSKMLLGPLPVENWSMKRLTKPFMDIQIIAKQFYDYSFHIRGYSKSTIKRYKYVIALYCRLFSITQLKDINHENIKSLFFHGRTVRNWQTATYIVFFKSLSVFFKWCIAERYLVTNPMEGIEKPRLEKKLPSKLTKQDAFRLLELIDNYPYNSAFIRLRNHAIFCMFICAGLRLNELLKLRFADVDLQNKTLFIYQGKGSKDRIIPINQRLLGSLEKYVLERKRMAKTCPEFFASFNRNMGFTESGMKRLVLQFREIAGVKFTVHKLRHTFATLMLEGGCDIYSLSKMMGHSDIKTTTIYLAASAEHLRSQMVKHPLNDLIRV
jgi:site-specific recombinase XerD